MDWVCDDDWIPPFTQAVFFVGAAIGTLLFGFAADRYGRYPSFVAANLLLMVVGIILPYCQDVYSFVAARFAMGLTHSQYYGLIYLLGMEIRSS